jgi:hypothetical protein
MAEQQQQEPMSPPKPPEIKREISFYRNQMIGLPIIALLPLLALFKVFDTSLDTVKSSNEGLSLSVRYPTKIRNRTIEPMQITVTNETGVEQKELEVHVSRGFVEKFKQIKFEPDVDDIERDSYVVQLKDVKPGEERTIDMDIETDMVGTHDCRVWASTGDEEASASFKTFVYP